MCDERPLMLPGVVCLEEGKELGASAALQEKIVCLGLPWQRELFARW